MNKFLLLLNVFAAILAFVSYFAPYNDPSQNWYFSFIGIAFPWILLGNILFIVYWLLTKSKKWYAIISLVAIIFGWEYVTAHVGMSFGRSTDDSKQTIKLMTYNLSLFDKFLIKNKKGEQLESDFYDFLSAQNSDIICFQEFLRAGALHNKIQGQIKEKTHMPYFYQNTTNSLAFFSKFPIVSYGTLPFGNASNGCVYVNVKIGKKEIRIYNVHLESNSVSGMADKIADEGDIQDERTWREVRSMLSIVKNKAPLRCKQARLIAENIRKCKIPNIVCGDFNETPMSYSYQLLKLRKKDTFQEAGFGIGTTYSGSIPGLKIDHILVSEQFMPIKSRVVRKNFSDHYAVISEIEF